MSADLSEAAVDTDTSELSAKQAEIDQLKQRLAEAEAPTDDTTEQPPKPPPEYDEYGNLRVTLSKRCVVTIRELNGQEALVADGYMGDTMNPMAMMKVYALMSLQSVRIDGIIKGLSNALTSKAGLMGRAKLFTARELMVLLVGYTDEYMGSPLEADALKNSPTLQPA